jgi:hypothetical protein
MTTREEEKDKDLERPVSFRLPPPDRAKLKEIAAAQGLTAGQLARKIVARDLGMQLKLNHVRTAIANADLLRRLLGEIGRLGNNLNQIAARLNASGSQSEAACDLDRLRDALEKALAAVITTLKRRRS